MKKVIVLFLFVCLLIGGVIVGTPTEKSEGTKVKDKIEEFEENIKDPNYNYESKDKEKVKPNLSNDIAKGGEKIISSVFDIAIDIVNGFINK
jgi:predicted PurR-regulated permease PerM